MERHRLAVLGMTWDLYYVSQEGTKKCTLIFLRKKGDLDLDF
jgi:hypothetical protein